MRVIGMDFGNFNVYMSCMLDMDSKTRRGGTPVNLVPKNVEQGGIPSGYALSKNGIPQIGQAIQRRYSPRTVNLLKRKMGNEVSVDLGKGRTVKVSVNDAITKVATHCIRVANKVLRGEHYDNEDSNLVALAYPANFDPRKLDRLVELIEAATLEDGRRVRVVGTIAEPAAAALDYLSSDEDLGTRSEVTALVMDLGAGTFDTALLTAYPSGKQDTSGNIKYYDLIDCCGIDVGGNEFTKVLCDYAYKEIGLNESQIPLWRQCEDLEQAEATKIALSAVDNQFDQCEMQFFDYDQGQLEEVAVSREEFENCASALLAQIVRTTELLVNRNEDVKVDVVVVTGGGGNMPMLQEAAGQIIHGVPARWFRPSRAISYGAAKYYTEGHGEAVIKHTDLDIGVEFFLGDTADKKEVCVGIPRGSELPYAQEDDMRSVTRTEDQENSAFPIMRALSENSNPSNPDEWEMIGKLVYQHAEPVPRGTRLRSRLSIDERGLLHIKCFAPDRPQDGSQEGTFYWSDDYTVDDEE